MKRLLFLLTLTGIFACTNKPEKENTSLEEDTTVVSPDSITKVETTTQKIVYETSTFDDPEFAEQSLEIRNKLKELDNAGVFDHLQSAQMAKVSEFP